MPCRSAAQARWTARFASWPARCVSGPTPSPCRGFPGALRLMECQPLALGLLSSSWGLLLRKRPRVLSPLRGQARGCGSWEVGWGGPARWSVPVGPAAQLWSSPGVFWCGGLGVSSVRGSRQHCRRGLGGACEHCPAGLCPVPWHSLWAPVAPAWHSGLCSVPCDPHAPSPALAPLTLLSGFLVFGAGR